MTKAESGDTEHPRRVAVLQALRSADGPLGVAELAEQLGIHPNTVRFHLDALVAEGRVDRRLSVPTGRGRPRTVHAPHPGMDRGGQRQYELLARMLLGQLTENRDAATEAEAAGRTWGSHLIERIDPLHRTDAAEAVQRLSTMMTELGFAPEPAGDDAGSQQIRLRNCPFLELAEEQSSTLCPLHLGLMRGALAEIRAPIEATRLEPFAAPDACLVHLSPTRSRIAGPRPRQPRHKNG